MSELISFPSCFLGPYKLHILQKSGMTKAIKLHIVSNHSVQKCQTNIYLSGFRFKLGTLQLSKLY